MLRILKSDYFQLWFFYKLLNLGKRQYLPHNWSEKGCESYFAICTYMALEIWIWEYGSDYLSFLLIFQPRESNWCSKRFWGLKNIISASN